MRISITMLNPQFIVMKFTSQVLISSRVHLLGYSPSTWGLSSRDGTSLLLHPPHHRQCSYVCYVTEAAFHYTVYAVVGVPRYLGFRKGVILSKRGLVTCDSAYQSTFLFKCIDTTQRSLYSGFRKRQFLELISRRRAIPVEIAHYWFIALCLQPRDTLWSRSILLRYGLQ